MFYIKNSILEKTADLNIREFCRQVILGEIITILIFVIACVLVCAILPPSLFRMIITFCIPNILFFTAIWFGGLDNHERDILKSIIIKLYK